MTSSSIEQFKLKRICFFLIIVPNPLYILADTNWFSEDAIIEYSMHTLYIINNRKFQIILRLKYTLASIISNNFNSKTVTFYSITLNKTSFVLK